MPEEPFVLSIIAIGCGTGLLYAAINRVGTIAKTWIQTSLKREMVARGYTANEIVAVVQAERKASQPFEMGGVPPAKPVRQPAV